MIVVESVAELRRELAIVGGSARSVGFVPTMGALHAGHLSLVKIAREQSDFVVMSLFVNPLQFNSREDLENYPRTLQSDVAAAQAAGVDLLFAPSVLELYPAGTGQDTNGGRVRLLAGSRSGGLCGGSRPGHFDGVVTVVSLLFHLVQPEIAVFGEKDYQQLRVIEQMVADQHFPVRIIAGETVRDSDGLALSSRNVRLSAAERYDALFISKVLFKAQDMVANGDVSLAALRDMALNGLGQAATLKIDYVEFVDAQDLTPVSEVIDRPVQMLVAAYVGPVRLIDNIRLNPR